MADYTRVYLRGRGVAHLLQPDHEPSDLRARTLCGPGRRRDRTWLGTGSWSEMVQATKLLPLCGTCESEAERIAGLQVTGGVR